MVVVVGDIDICHICASFLFSLLESNLTLLCLVFCSCLESNGSRRCGDIDICHTIQVVNMYGVLLRRLPADLIVSAYNGIDRVIND